MEAQRTPCRQTHARESPSVASFRPSVSRISFPQIAACSTTRSKLSYPAGRLDYQQVPAREEGGMTSHDTPAPSGGLPATRPDDSCPLAAEHFAEQAAILAEQESWGLHD